MLLLSMAAVINGWWHQQQASELGRALAQVQQALTQEEQRIAVPSVDARLQQQVDEAERTVVFATQRLNYLQNHQQGFARQNQSQRPFLALMQQLGDTRLDSIWLSRVGLADRGANVALSGLLQRPDAISDYLAALNKLPAWQGIVFQQVSVDAQPSGYRFALDTLPKPLPVSQATSGSLARQVALQPSAQANPQLLLSGGRR